MYILFIAPFHSTTDKRVCESIKLSKDYFTNFSVLYDSNYNKVDVGKQNNSYFYPIEIISFWKIKIPNLKKWVYNLRQEIIDCDIIYIHDSGIMGIIISKILSNFNKPIILDYHDNVFYELYYQLKKIKISLFYPILKYPFFWLLKKFTKNISYLVGINQIQINQFVNFFNFKSKSVVVSNFRNSFTEINYSSNKKQLKIDLLWVGNVMRGRDLELISTILLENIEYNIHVVGHILDNKFKNELIYRLGDRIIFYGAFKNENEILNLISFKPIGIYLGWEDRYCTKINEMSSPNKIFTYINLEIPFVFSNRLLNSSSILNSNIGYPINMELNSYNIGKEFFSAINIISTEYEKYVGSLIDFKKFHNNLNQKANNYFNEIRKLLN